MACGKALARISVRPRRRTTRHTRRLMRFAGLRRQVRVLAAIDPGLALPGARSHEYQLAPPLTEAELTALEDRLGPLPPEYRRFLRTFAAHGAGPHLGIGEPHAPAAADPSRAFLCERATPHDAPCPPAAHLLDGTVVLAEHGGGGRSLLVVRGARAGEVWSDAMRAQGPVAPEAPNLAAWYERWIAGALRGWRERNAQRLAIDGPASAAELEALGLSHGLADPSVPIVGSTPDPALDHAPDRAADRAPAQAFDRPHRHRRSHE